MRTEPAAESLPVGRGDAGAALPDDGRRDSAQYHRIQKKTGQPYLLFDEELEISSEAMRRAGIPEDRISVLKADSTAFYERIKKCGEK